MLKKYNWYNNLYILHCLTNIYILICFLNVFMFLLRNYAFYPQKKTFFYIGFLSYQILYSLFFLYNHTYTLSNIHKFLVRNINIYLVLTPCVTFQMFLTFLITPSDIRIDLFISFGVLAETNMYCFHIYKKVYLKKNIYLLICL